MVLVPKCTGITSTKQAGIKGPPQAGQASGLAWLRHSSFCNQAADMEAMQFAVHLVAFKSPAQITRYHLQLGYLGAASGMIGGGLKLMLWSYSKVP